MQVDQLHPGWSTILAAAKPAQTREMTIEHTSKPTHNLFTYSSPCTPNLCSELSIYKYSMGVGPAWVGLSTDVQNVPIDTVSDTHKL